MIKANELRIGNCIKLNNSYTTLVPRDFQRYCKSFGIFEEFEQIPITEDWLLKADFEKIENGKYLNSFYVTIINNYCVFWITDTYSIAIEYVHQLQNLYFALCGEELVFSSTEP